MSRSINFVILSSLIISTATLILCQREGRRVTTTDFYKDFKSPCGSAGQLSKRLGGCMSEIFDITEGRVPEPKGDAELLGLCTRFNNTERCARTIAKDCLSGIHKTATSSVSTALKRWRTRECKTAENRKRYVEPVKCSMKVGSEVTKVYHNHTGLLQGVRDLNIPPEEKLIKMCCVLNAFDTELEGRYNRECPQYTQLVMGIVHALTDDARSTLCVNPKCNGALDKVLRNRYKPPQNFLEPVLDILFQISLSN